MRLAPVRAMVTGGAGFLGSGLVDRLLAEGHGVEVVDDLSTGSLANLAEARAAGGALRFHQLDVRAPELIELMGHLRPEVVFHLASGPGASASLAQPVLDAELTVLGALQVLEGARAAGTRKVVVAASSALYGELDPSDLPAHEHLSLRPRTPHGVAKKAVLEYLSVYRELYGLEFTALALSSVYGPRRIGTSTPGAVAAFAEDLMEERPPSITGDGSQTRDLLYVDDAVDAFSRAAERGSGLLLNVATGKETAIGELLSRMTALSGAAGGPPVRAVAARPGEVRRVVLDPTRAAIHLGWRPFTSLEEGLHTVLETARARAVARALPEPGTLGASR